VFLTQFFNRVGVPHLVSAQPLALSAYFHYLLQPVYPLSIMSMSHNSFRSRDRFKSCDTFVAFPLSKFAGHIT